MSPHGLDTGRQMRWAVVAVVTLAVALGLTLGFVLYQSTRPERWDPLGPYPVQTVLSRVEGVKGPAVMLGDDLRVAGQKCNASSRPVTTRGSYEWVMVIPPGSIIPAGSGSAIRVPGCTAFDYLNPMPEAVVARSEKVKANTGVDPVWRISGKDTPYSVKHGVGEPRTYISENFTIVVP